LFRVTYPGVVKMPVVINTEGLSTVHATINYSEVQKQDNRFTCVT